MPPALRASRQVIDNRGCDEDPAVAKDITVPNEMFEDNRCEAIPSVAANVVTAAAGGWKPRRFARE